uniref:Odorant receptor n=1 Tax=Tenebrio molitor TaxID=7067 RepID=A0A0C5D1J5_TENMO|nr:olfactory receptor OR17 [Tenebrio molitor]
MANYDWTSTIKVHITCFRLLGFWPKNDGYNFDLYTLWAVFAVIFFGFVQTFVETVKIFTNLNDLEIVTGTAFVSFSEILILLKIFYLARNTKTFKRLLVTLNSDMFQPTNDQMSLILPELNSWKLMYKFFCICAAVTVAFWLLVPMFQVRRLPFLAWYPFDAKISPNYEIAYVHQSISVSYISISNVHVDTLIGAMSMYTAAQLTILKDNLRKLKPEQFEEDLIRCVKHHREVLKFAKSFNDVFNWIILVQFFASAISIGFSMFLVTIVTPFSEEFFSFAFYGFSASFEIFIYCWFANEIQVKSDQVPLSAFQSDWLGASEEAKKSLIIFMANAQRPLKISALNLVDLSLNTFLKILKTSWSYFALVSQLHE